ncbi:MAG: DNA alkylation repair protein [Clostridia bacterium]|nr:DNA alkylation repair protein [Clostridia bacterium]
MNEDARYNLLEKLKEKADPTYRNFNFSLIPNISPDTGIGVRTPDLRAIAKEFMKEDPEGADLFLSSLPHRYFEENLIHGFLIQNMKDRARVIALLEEFVPYIDNWAVCDTISPKIFRKNPLEKEIIYRWIDSGKTYHIRFAVLQLMQCYLENDTFSPEYLEKVAEIKSTEYYVNMMRAWFFQVALYKQYDSAIRYIEEKRLDVWTHNKAIQKSVESFRLSDEKKAYLKSLRRKNEKR